MNFFDTSALESALRRILLDGGVAEVVYANRPKSAPTRENRFAVVSVAGNLDDMACYGDCVVRITLYARDAAGLKDSRALSEMQKALCGCLPPSYDYEKDGKTAGSYLFGTTPTVVGDSADDYGFHARTLILRTIIKVI